MYKERKFFHIYMYIQVLACKVIFGLRSIFVLLHLLQTFILLYPSTRAYPPTLDSSNFVPIFPRYKSQCKTVSTDSCNTKYRNNKISKIATVFIHWQILSSMIFPLENIPTPRPCALAYLSRPPPPLWSANPLCQTRGQTRNNLQGVRAWTGGPCYQI